MRIKITKISKNDAYYPDRHNIIGKEGDGAIVESYKDDWTGLIFRPDEPISIEGEGNNYNWLYLYKCDYETIY